MKVQDVGLFWKPCEFVLVVVCRSAQAQAPKPDVPPDCIICEDRSADSTNSFLCREVIITRSVLSGLNALLQIMHVHLPAGLVSASAPVDSAFQA